MKQPIVMIKTREEPRSSDTVSTSVQSIPSLLAGEGAHRPSPDSTRQSGQDGKLNVKTVHKLSLTVHGTIIGYTLLLLTCTKPCQCFT